MDNPSRRTRHNLVQGRFPQAQPQVRPATPEGSAEHPGEAGLPAPSPPRPAALRRLARVCAEWGWLAYLLIAFPAVVAAVTASPPPLGGAAAAVIAGAGFAAVIAGLRAFRPPTAHAWYPIAAAIALFAAGDVIGAHYEQLFHRPEPFPSLADGLYLAAYPLIGAGLMMLVRGRHPKRDRASLVDTLVFTIGIGSVCWIFLIAPFLRSNSLTDLAQLTIVLRLLGDIALMGFAARLILGSRERSPSLLLLSAAIAALGIADATTAAIYLSGGAVGDMVELGRMLFPVLAGAAALHPSLLDLGSPVADGDAGLSRKRLIALTSASLAGPGIVVIRSLAGDPLDIALLTLSFSILFALVVLRMGDLVRHHEDVRRGEDALRTAGEALITAASRDHIYEAAMVAATSLLGQDVPTVLYAYAEDTAMLVPVAATDGRPGTVAPIAIGELPARVRAYLTDRGDAAMNRSADNLPWWQGSCLAPLIGREALHGVVAVSPGAPLPRAARETLATLTTQLALALESASVAETAVRSEGEARLSSLVEHASDMICILDRETAIRYASPSIERVLGHRPEAVIGQHLRDFLHPDDRSAALAYIHHIGEQGGRPMPTEFRLRHGSGEWRDAEALATNLLDNQSVGGIVLNVRDVSERKAFEAQLTHQAFHDALTGLPNRALFRDRLERALERKRRDGDPAAILFLDLDDFKAINDTFGHAAGDDFLVEIGGRLRRAVRRNDIVARLGGDEFVILLEDVGKDAETARETARAVAAKAQAGLRAGFRVGKVHHLVTSSIGVVVFDGTETSADDLLKYADLAMYDTKVSGKSGINVFDPTLLSREAERYQLVRELHEAITWERLLLHFQPVIDRHGRVCGAEGLLRWPHPTRGLLGPEDFVLLAERAGLVNELTRHVLNIGVQTLSVWQSDPRTAHLSLSLNIGMAAFMHPDFTANLRRLIDLHEIEANKLTLELTEQIMSRDKDAVRRRMEEAKALGVRFSLDDFGTGRSSVENLKLFLFDEIKIDGGYVSRMETQEVGRMLVKTVLAMAKALEIEAVAEHVETERQLDFLMENGCDRFQGYLFASPKPSEDFLLLVRGDPALERANVVPLPFRA